MVISLYVDDLLVIGNNLEMKDEFKEEMKRVFNMTDLGEMSYFHGMKIRQTDNEVFISTKKYERETMKKFKMKDFKPMNTLVNQKKS